MKTSATNRRIRILITALKDNSLIPRPEFQRRLVWTNKHKQEFIRTVLMEYPFPEIYVATGDVDPDTGAGQEMLVDGQQRLTTLFQYFSGSDELRLGDVRSYSALSPEEKLAFLEYEVVVRDLGKKSIEEIKEVFKRINSTKYSLNAMEIHNARFDGAFKHFGEELTQHAFFEENRVFKTNDIRRMGDLVFSLTMTITMMATYFNREDELEKYLEMYNDEFLDAERVRDEIGTVFAFVADCRFDSRSRAWRKAELLNILVETHRALIRERLDISSASVGKGLAELFERVDKVGAGASDAEEVTGYYKSSIQATNDRSNRIKRGQIIAQVIREGVTF
jgi:hypothetical protein